MTRKRSLKKRTHAQLTAERKDLALKRDTQLASMERSALSGLYEVYVSGIPMDMANEETMGAIFGLIGTVKHWFKLPEKSTVPGRGNRLSGFISYRTAAEAEEAVRMMDGYEIYPGLSLRVKPAERRKKTDGCVTDTEEMVRRPFTREPRGGPHGFSDQNKMFSVGRHQQNHASGSGFGDQNPSGGHHQQTHTSVKISPLQQKQAPSDGSQIVTSPSAISSPEDLIKSWENGQMAKVMGKGNRCAFCGNVGLLQCAQCKSVRYCKQACQASHWRTHQHDCLRTVRPLMSPDIRVAHAPTKPSVPREHTAQVTAKENSPGTYAPTSPSAGVLAVTKLAMVNNLEPCTPTVSKPTSQESAKHDSQGTCTPTTQKSPPKVSAVEDVSKRINSHATKPVNPPNATSPQNNTNSQGHMKATSPPDAMSSQTMKNTKQQNTSQLTGPQDSAKPAYSRSNSRSSSDSENLLNKRDNKSADNGGDRHDKGQGKSNRFDGNKGGNKGGTAHKVDTNTNNAVVIKNIGADLQKGQKVVIQVGDMDSPSKFWARLGENEDRLNAHQVEIQQFYSGSGQVRRANMEKPDPLVAALFAVDNQWYRACILNRQGNQFKVRYVDYGNVDIVNNVFFLERKFYELPVMCLCCGIGGISSVSDVPWSQQSNKLFGELLGNGLCHAVIQEHTSDVTFMQVLTSTGENISQKLVDAKHACFTGVAAEIRALPRSVGSDKPAQVSTAAQPTATPHSTSTPQAVATHQVVPAPQVVGTAQLVPTLHDVPMPLAALVGVTSQAAPTPMPSEGAADVVMASSLTKNPLTVGTTETAMVTDAASPVLFTIQLASRDCMVIQNLTGAIMNFLAKNTEAYAPKKVGELILGEFSSEWCRGEVLNIDDQTSVKVFFLDYGNQDDLAPTRMRAVPMGCGLNDYPVLGLKCALHGVSGVAPGKEWDPNMLNPFSALFNLEVKETSGDKLLVQVTPQVDGAISINKQLLDSGVLLPPISYFTLKDLPILKVPLQTKVACIIVEAPAATCVRLQIITPEASASFQEVSKILTNEKSDFVRGYSAKKSEVVCGFYDGAWNRAEIIATNPVTGQFKVRYIDWGNVEIVSSESLARLAVGLDKFVPVSVQCGLVGVKPEGWDPDCLRQDIEYTVKLVKNNEGWYEGELFDNEDTLVNAKLNLPTKVSTVADLPSAVPLPMNTPLAQCTVIHIESPAEFYIIKDVEQFKAVAIELQKLDKNTAPTLTPTTPGQLVCAYIDGDWYRMSVKTIASGGTHATLASLDFGFNQPNFSVANLYELPRALLTFPPLAVQCCLMQVTSENQTFDQATILNFNDVALNQVVQLTLMEIRGDKCVTKMFDLENETDIGSLIIPEQPPVASPPRPVIPELAQKSCYPTVDALPKQSVMPDTFQGAMTHSVDPSHFYVQSYRDVEELTEIINKTISACDKPLPTEGFVPHRGELCFGLNPVDSCWYRCVVTGKTTAGYNVQFIDFGDSAILAAEHVRPLTKELLTYSPKAYTCQLAGIFANPDGPWSATAATRFKELASKALYTCHKKQTNTSFYLINMRHETEGDVAETLVAENLAVRRHTNQPSASSLPSKDGYISAAEVERNKLKREYAEMQRKMAVIEAQLRDNNE